MEQENIVIVKCPKCRLQLSFLAVPNYQERNLTCPKCKFTAKTNNFQVIKRPGQPNISREEVKPQPKQERRPIDDMVGRTYMPNETEGNTEDPLKTQMMSETKVTIKCLNTGEEYELQSGENTIGRKCSSPRAKYLFTDDERYMGRLHALIKVVSVGGKTQLHLSDLDSVNGTKLKGRKLPRRSIALVKPGDLIEMGEMRFVCHVQEGQHVSPINRHRQGGDTTTLN